MNKYSSAHISETNSFVAIYYETPVFTYLSDSKTLIFKTGGFNTISTAKAINKALNELKLDSLFRARKKDFSIYIQRLDTGEMHLVDKTLNVTLS